VPGSLASERREDAALEREGPALPTGGFDCEFTFCPGTGGSSNFDPWLCLFDADGNLLARNDDPCGLESQIIALGLAAGTYRIAAGLFADSAGDCTLAYRARRGRSAAATPTATASSRSPTRATA
jgi:hypothetical protein